MSRVRLAFAGLLALVAVPPAVAADLPVRRAAPEPAARQPSIPRHFDIEQHIHVIKLGLNYRFGLGPAVAAAY
jgi:hypothetical protein